MYGKYIVGHNNFIEGEDGYSYRCNMGGETISHPNETIVRFHPIDSSSEHREAKIDGAIDVTPMCKKTLKANSLLWDQEASRDKGVFVSTKAFEEVKNGRLFAIGRKGTGKTALGRQLLENNSSIGGIFSLDNFPFTQVYCLNVKSYHVTIYQQIWMVVYITLALKSLLRDTSFSESERGKIEKFAKTKAANNTNRISNGIANFLDKPLTKFTGIGIGFLSGVDPVSIIKIIVDTAAEKSDGEIVTSIGDVESELVQLYKSLKNTPKVVVVFDQLDEEYKQSNEASYAILIESLFAATVAISQLELKIRPLVLLREDIFDSVIISNNKAKYLSDIAFIEWSKGDLQQVIQTRLEVSADTNSSFDEHWLNLFVPFFKSKDRSSGTVGGEESPNSYKWFGSYECFIRHTSRTPRDCIQLLKEVINCLVLSTGKTLCDSDIFIQAREKYSIYYTQQVIDASNTIFPTIKDLLLADKSPKMRPIELKKHIRHHLIASDYSELNKLLAAAAITKDSEILQSIKEESTRIKAEITHKEDLQFQKYLKLLWDLCAIGVHNNRHQFRAKYTDIALGGFKIANDEQIIFHPAVAVWVGLDVPIQLNIKGWVSSIEGKSKPQRQFESVTSIRAFNKKDLIDPRKRELIQHEIIGQEWPVTVLKVIHGGAIFLQSPNFPSNIYCPAALIRNEGYSVGESLIAKVAITHTATKGWNFVAAMVWPI